MSAGAWEVGRVFLKLGAVSYGGPAMMGIMQAELERKRQWVTRERFVEGLALVNFLPGPLAVQLSIVLGSCAPAGSAACWATWASFSPASPSCWR